ncbi:SDR family oxidoreductase [Leucobacter triazinivorans]|uniref:SDR family oxidoreductase n=1 Tax=Leucobacter triazinivorans TaxID=1784719 RepID=A0A4P6KDC4_9MICO|nr:SDR family oxidoreductase [Leucobacter triazinivorans]QBE48163.1 SDR family oxidoreductase [Leucobacter triazinivorans]
MARIIIFGGHGKIALLAEALLAERGDEVTAVIRNPDHEADVRAAGARPLVADVERLDTTGIADLVRGHDAVVWSAGAGGGDPARTMAVDRDAAIRSMDASLLAGVSRYVMVSYFGSSPEHGVDPQQPFFSYAEAKAAADEHLRATRLDWTVLGPSTLTSDPPTGRVDTGAAASSRVSRGNVARVIVAALADDGTIHRTIRFNDGEQPIAQALAS